MNTTDVNILIADDHKMIRDGLRLMLSLRNSPYNFFITEATDGAEAVSIALKKDFDILMLDYRMPKINGDDAIQRIKMYKPDIKVIILSNYNEKGFVQSSISSGAKGYILKDVDTSELVEALTTVLDGGTYFSSSIQDKVEKDEEPLDKKMKTLCRQLGISGRELEVLRLISSELTNEEIALRLDISKRTVDTHRQNLLFKLKAKNTAGLVKFAYANRLMD